MSTLHVFSSLEPLEMAHPFIGRDDHVLLVQQASYLALPTHPKKHLLTPISSLSFLALDLDSRGLSERCEYPAITMSDWVTLTARHSKTINWG